MSGTLHYYYFVPLLHMKNGFVHLAQLTCLVSLLQMKNGCVQPAQLTCFVPFLQVKKSFVFPAQLTSFVSLLQMKNGFVHLARMLERAVFYDLVRSIYEVHHLTLTFAVAVKKMLSEGKVSPEEWQHFLTNGTMR